MADSTSAPIMPPPFAPGSSDFDDALEDVCSICLEAFASSDPAIVTTCKHEYHLQCILDWSQRSKACPICWQSLALTDPSCQELLASVQIEQISRSRQFSGPPFVLPLHNNDYETEYEPGSELSERILQRMAAAVSRARYARSQTKSLMEIGASDSSSSSSLSPVSPEIFAFSDSIKSKLSAASAKYKHSFSKGTQGFKEKFAINNSSVKELSRGVQREMSAGIAGLTKMIDRLEIKSKTGSQIFNEVQRPFDNIFSKGKQVQKDVAFHPKPSHSIQSSHRASNAKDEN